MGYDTGAYSYPYLAGYATDADMKELHASLGTIRKTSSMIISKVEDELGNIYMERNPEIVPDNEPVKGDDTPLKAAGDVPGKDKEKDTASTAAMPKEAEPVVAERKILGTVRILPDGRGHMKQSLLDNLRIRVDSIRNETREKAAEKKREVAAK